GFGIAIDQRDHLRPRTLADIAARTKQCVPFRRKGHCQIRMGARSAMRQATALFPLAAVGMLSQECRVSGPAAGVSHQSSLRPWEEISTKRTAPDARSISSPEIPCGCTVRRSLSII